MLIKIKVLDPSHFTQTLFYISTNPISQRSVKVFLGVYMPLLLFFGSSGAYAPYAPRLHIDVENIFCFVLINS